MVSDPEHPSVVETQLSTGITYYHQVEQRDEVLVYTSATLEEPLTIIGEPSASLQVSANTPDADVMVRLTEVYADGRSVSLGFGANLRLRYRDGFDKEVPLEKALRAWSARISSPDTASRHKGCGRFEYV